MIEPLAESFDFAQSVKSTKTVADIDVNLIPAFFTEHESNDLMEICRNWKFIDRLEQVRRDYACSLNNSHALTASADLRKKIATVEKHGCGWALNTSPVDKLPSASDVRKAMGQLSRQAKELREFIENLGPIATSVLLKKGISPLIEQRGLGWPGLDSGLTIRLNRLLKKPA